MKELHLPSGNLLMFEELSHTYRIGPDWESGKRCPGSHEVMERAEIIEPMNDFARPYVERGKRVHTATELDDLGEFDPDGAWAKSPEMAYLTAYRKFKAEHPEFSAPDKIEELVGSEDYWAATIVDRAFNDGFRILQIKTGQPAKYHAVQLAIEGLLAYPSAGVIERFVVYLAPDASFTLKQLDDQESMDVALSVLGARMKVRKFLATRAKRKQSVKV
jgi:hypothetical protein